MSTLLLGVNGQVGHELRRALAIHGALLAPPRTQLDLTDLAAVDDFLHRHQPDTIVNAAAYTAVDKAESETALARRLNTELPDLLARYSADHEAVLVHYSSDYVYPGGGDQPWHEDSPTGPLSIYGQSKLDGDEAIVRRGCSHLIFRTSWVYSARGSNFLKTMLRLGGERDSLAIVADQVGAPTPARLIADVSAHALRRYREAAELGGLYHLAPRGVTSWHGFACEIFRQARHAGMALAIDPERVSAIASDDYPTPATRPLNSRLGLSRLESAFALELPDWQSQLSLTLHDLLP